MVLLTRRQGRIACGINRRDSIRSRPTPAIKKKSNWPAGHQVIQSGKHLSNTGEVVQNTGGLLGKSGNIHFDSGKQVRNTGNVLFKSGEVVLNTGNIVGNTGNLLQDTGEVVEKTGDVLRNSGNVVRNTGKAVGNTGDLLRKTGNVVGNTGAQLLVGDSGMHPNVAAYRHAEIPARCLADGRTASRVQIGTAGPALQRVFGPKLESGRAGACRQGQCGAEILLHSEVSADFDVPKYDGIEPHAAAHFGTNEVGV